MIGKLKRRYANLSGTGFSEKLMYAVFVRLKQTLFNRGVVDLNGSRTQPVKEHRPHKDTPSPSPRIVCLTGFGHSGSGAVADLLSEYDEVQVVSHIDPDGSLRKASEEEFDLLCGAGGLFSIEEAFKTRNERVRDLAVKLFLRFVDSLYVYSCGTFNDDFVDLTRKFLDKIVAWKTKDGAAGGYAFSPHLSILGTHGSRLVFGSAGTCWLRDMTAKEYRAVAADYVKGVLSLFTGAQSRTLVLDQALTDGSCDMEKYEDYLGEIRLIATYRDPRDVYATARTLTANWIPSDPDFFARWYLNRLEPYVHASHPHLKMLRFESLVSKYDEVVAEIESFTGLTPAAHTRIRAGFDPSRSIRNVGLYRGFPDQMAIRRIESQLKDFCF